MQAAYVHWRSSESPQARRTMFGLAMLLGAQLLIFAISALGVLGLLNLQLFLPPLDRAVMLFSLVWIVWLWAFPEPSLPADAATWLLTVLVAAGLGLSLVSYSAEPVLQPYNMSLADLAWQMASVAVIVFGLIILLLRRPNGWGNGVAVLALCGMIAAAYSCTTDMPAIAA